MWDTAVLIVLSIKDFFFKQRTPDNQLDVKPGVPGILDTATDGSVSHLALGSRPGSVDLDGGFRQPYGRSGQSVVLKYDPTFTDHVVRATGRNANSRLKQVMPSLLRHMHDFCRENDITVDEWMAATNLMNEAGKMSTDSRNEGQLIGDILGLASLTDEITSKLAGDGATATALQGPFWRAGAPKMNMGDSIVSVKDEKMTTFVHGSVLDANTGRPIQNAEIDVWHTAPNGLYENEDPDQPDMNLRGKFTTATDGQFNFYCLRPVSYSIPMDGAAGKLLQLLDRHPMRPAHLHFIIKAPGYRTIITQVFDRQDERVNNDAVFAVKESLIVDFVPKQGDPKAQYDLHYDFKLTSVDRKHFGDLREATASALAEGN